MDLDACQDMAVGLLKELIRIPSPSREEQKVADLMQGFLEDEGLKAYRHHQNVWAAHRIRDNAPSILLNSHLDTVKPAAGWKRN